MDEGITARGYDLHFSEHTGIHMDAPTHFTVDGKYQWHTHQIQPERYVYCFVYSIFIFMDVTTIIVLLQLSCPLLNKNQTTLDSTTIGYFSIYHQTWVSKKKGTVSSIHFLVLHHGSLGLEFLFRQHMLSALFSLLL